MGEMRYDSDDLVLDPHVLRERASRCFRLARTLPLADAAVLEALGHEYEAEAAKLESANRTGAAAPVEALVP